MEKTITQKSSTSSSFLNRLLCRNDRARSECQLRRVTNLFGSHVLRQTQLAWAAGLCDGEGCISIARYLMKGRKNLSYRLRLDVVQNNLQTLEQFQKIASDSGAISHLNPLRRTTDHNRQIYVLQFDGRHAAACLAALLPYLVRKRPEAQVALDYMRDASPSVLPGPQGLSQEVWQIRERYYRKLRKMK